jgi:hypothetical protein
MARNRTDSGFPASFAAYQRGDDDENDETMSGRRKDLPQSGVAGIRWSEAHGKWIVRFKGADHRVRYLGLFERDDLDEAKSVLAAARVQHGEGERAGHDDSTTQLSDAILAERFVLDGDGDVFWIEKPIVGTKAQMQEAARWNSRHAGLTLPKRISFLHEGRRYQRVYAADIVKRLAAIRDAENPSVATAETQGECMPQGHAPGDYETKLAEALAIEDRAAREAKAEALEGEIIPPDPVGKGPLALLLMETKRRLDLNQPDLLVLSIGKDPFEQDTPRGHAYGRWLRVRLDLHAYGRIIHIRGIHYLLVAVQVTKPDGTRYENTKKDYEWLNDRVAKAARWLRYVGFDEIVDERNEEAVRVRAERVLTPISVAYVTTGYAGSTVVLPEPLAIHRAEPRPILSGFDPKQRFCFAVFGEKSSLNEVLKPFVQRHNADLFIAVGELSERRAYEMARDAVRDGRKLICFTFSDFDPSGMQMPVSIAVKLMALRELEFPSLEFAIVPAALTLEQVIRLRLPTAMVDKKDKRRKLWQQTFAPPLIEAGLLPESARWQDGDEDERDAGGKMVAKPLAQVEIDALAAINPAELDRIAEAAIAPYLDATLNRRAEAAKSDWIRRAQEALTQGSNRTRLDMLSHAERLRANRFNGLLRSLTQAKDRVDAIEAAMEGLVRGVALPPIPELPEAEPSLTVEPLEAGEPPETVEPLVDSDWGYLHMVEAMKARKKYENED